MEAKIKMVEKTQNVNQKRDIQKENIPISETFKKWEREAKELFVLEKIKDLLDHKLSNRI